MQKIWGNIPQNNLHFGHKSNAYHESIVFAIIIKN